MLTSKTIDGTREVKVVGLDKNRDVCMYLFHGPDMFSNEKVGQGCEAFWKEDDTKRCVKGLEESLVSEFGKEEIEIQGAKKKTRCALPSLGLVPQGCGSLVDVGALASEYLRCFVTLFRCCGWLLMC